MSPGLLGDLPLQLLPGVVQVVERRVDAVFGLELQVMLVEQQRGAGIFDGVMRFRLDVDPCVGMKEESISTVFVTAVTFNSPRKCQARNFSDTMRWWGKWNK